MMSDKKVYVIKKKRRGPQNIMTVTLEGVDEKMELRPAMARDAAEKVTEETEGVEVWETNYFKGYALYPNSVRKLFRKDRTRYAETIVVVIDDACPLCYQRGVNAIFQTTADGKLIVEYVCSDAKCKFDEITEPDLVTMFETALGL
jgi:hypothetical protein